MKKLCVAAYINSQNAILKKVEGQGSIEDTFRSEERPAIEHSEVSNMNEGEMIVFGNGKMHRAVAQTESTLFEYGKPTTYCGKTADKIPLMQYIGKDEFFSLVNPIVKRQQDKLNLYSYLDNKNA
ncbi:hypothetical protein CSPB12327_02990 [Campylobacter sp. RM12327]|uniref:hypothetical protein n=1 Tax=Campylobacter sputorum TaxID=206 RepID=UPI000B77AB69|nr:MULTISPECIES: hypothetical protein [Campylobacter]ASM40499.1 hypothetical protein CSPB_1308 [Campylobacter sputorum]MBE7357836.1 hypothetical protein [Campylobacter sp. RM11302]MBF6669114.1 hypothetical protein [Campylobacter sp. RM12327]MBF6673877.1 hypothetical protein [Campylobacter sp. RM13538]MBF6675854.1 hypothetical protein [Campylobacter sp. RM12321]